LSEIHLKIFSFLQLIPMDKSARAVVSPRQLKTTVCLPELCVYSAEHHRFQSGDPAFTAKCVEGAHSQPNCNC
jgi:hypothetical protein